MNCRLCGGCAAHCYYRTLLLCERCFKRKRYDDVIIRDSIKRHQRALKLKKEVKLKEDDEI